MKKIYKFLLFIIPTVIFSFLALLMKGYRISLLKSGIYLSAEKTCTYHCLESTVISLAIIPFAIFLIGWSTQISYMINKKFPNSLRRSNKSVLPPIWFMRLYGICMILIIPIIFVNSCGCLALVKMIFREVPWIIH